MAALLQTTCQLKIIFCGFINDQISEMQETLREAYLFSHTEVFPLKPSDTI